MKQNLDTLLKEIDEMSERTRQEIDRTEEAFLEETRRLTYGDVALLTDDMIKAIVDEETFKRIKQQDALQEIENESLKINIKDVVESETIEVEDVESTPMSKTRSTLRRSKEDEKFDKFTKMSTIVLVAFILITLAAIIKIVLT